MNRDEAGNPSQGLYENIISNALEEDLKLAADAGLESERERLLDAEGPRALSKYFSDLLEAHLEGLKAEDRVQSLNRLIDHLGDESGTDNSADLVTSDSRPQLTLVTSKGSGLSQWRPPRPEIPLNTSDLLMNNRQGPTMSRSLESEIASADDVLIIVSFIMWSGLRLLLPSLQSAVERGARVRVLTTTYMGATQSKALDSLVSIGAEVRINYDTQGTRLHAKGWLFERNSGLSTAYIGSSNMSKAAMSVGQEWNVRISAAETPHLVQKFRAVFTSFWLNPGNGFEIYDPRIQPEDRLKLDRALALAKGNGSLMPLGTDEMLPFEVEPLPFQEEMLEDLDREREVFGRRYNLVVAATGTGKTLVAAFDYRRLTREWAQASDFRRRPRLLYVAHRAEILRQARRAFRHVLREPDFGDLLVDGETPDSDQFVFASVQSLTEDRLRELASDYYDYVVVDEFHHAGARTWSRLLNTLKPKYLLGLTATPERSDGIDILQWFDGHVATEIRLWEALERNLLVPFHYFGIGDEALDYQRVTWSGGKYNVTELEGILTGDDAFMHRAVNQLLDKVSDPSCMRCLVFAVSISHAKYVAQFLNSRGIRAQAITSDEGSPDRQDAVRKLRNGEVQALVTVDLFNEGVDIPEVDTLVLLRPTESQTVFLQQLGRGLRHSENKDVLTVLDFVGLQNKRFRYDQRFQSLTGTPRARLVTAVEAGFPFLPSGSSIQLDEVASSIVLENIRTNTPRKLSELTAEIAEFLPASSPIEESLRNFLRDSGRDLSDIYRDRKRSWTDLLRQTGRDLGPQSTLEALLLSRVNSLVHVDDTSRIEAYRGLISGSRIDLSSRRNRIFATMLHHSLWSTARREWRSRGEDRILEGLELLHSEPNVVEELLQVLVEAQSRIRHVSYELDGPLRELPIRVHARYSRAEMLAGVDWADVDREVSGQVAGVRFAPRINADIFDVTWQKSEREYSPNTMYRDYAVSPVIINWETQNAAHLKREAVKRYISHQEAGTDVLMFARESKSWEFASSRPFLFLGRMQYLSHSGERPVTFRWRLERPMPAEFFTASEILAG